MERILADIRAETFVEAARWNLAVEMRSSATFYCGVMDAAAGYVAHVDRVLAAAAALLAPAPGGAGTAEAGVSRPIDAPGGTSGLSSGAVAAGERYTAAVGAADSAASGSAAAVAGAVEAAREAAHAAESLRAVTRARAAALLPGADTPAGLRVLVDTMAAALAGMQDQIGVSRAQLSATAAEVRRTAAEWQDVLEP